MDSDGGKLFHAGNQMAFSLCSTFNPSRELFMLKINVRQFLSLKTLSAICHIRRYDSVRFCMHDGLILDICLEGRDTGNDKGNSLLRKF